MIKKITIKVGDKKVKLSEDEAREIYNDLHRMFGTINYYPFHHTTDTVRLPITLPNTPINPNTTPYFEITCEQAGVEFTQ